MMRYASTIPNFHNRKLSHYKVHRNKMDNWRITFVQYLDSSLETALVFSSLRRVVIKPVHIGTLALDWFFTNF
jgi:hypothetical protein